MRVSCNGFLSLSESEKLITKIRLKDLRFMNEMFEIIKVFRIKLMIMDETLRSRANHLESS